MSQQPQICLHQLSYQIANQEPLFTDLTLNLVNKRIGIIGKNGIGKSTLFALITGSIKPTAGSINVAGSFAILPQNTKSFMQQTVAEIFGVAQKLFALKQIENGICDEKYFMAPLQSKNLRFDIAKI